MPYKGSYRGRAVKKVRQQGNRKLHNPTVKFILNKSYVVSQTAGQAYPTHMLTINASSPFQPIHQIAGDWDSNDNTNEPMGLSSDLYQNYQHLVVKGCHITASVTDEPDEAAESTETLTKGILAIARHTDIGSIPYSTFNANMLKTMYGVKSKNFQLSPRGSGAGTATVSNNILTKNAKVSNGYSAKKTWNTSANANDDLRVANVSGSANIASDNTYLTIGLMPQRVIAAPSPLLQPTHVNVRIVYIIQFQEPTFKQTVPAPMSFGNGGKKSTGKSWSDSFTETVSDVLNSPLGRRILNEAFRRGVNYNGGRNVPRMNFNGVDVD